MLNSVCSQERSLSMYSTSTITLCRTERCKMLQIKKCAAKWSLDYFKVNLRTTLHSSSLHVHPSKQHNQLKSHVTMNWLPTFPSPLFSHNWLTDIIYHLNYALLLSPSLLPSLSSFLSTKHGAAALLFSYRLPSGIISSLITEIKVAPCSPFPLPCSDAS